MSEFDLVEVTEPIPNLVQNFANGLIKEGNMVSSRIGTDLRIMKEKLFNRPDWAAEENPMAILQQHVDAMGVAGVVMFSASGFQARIAAVLKRVPKDDPMTGLQILEGAKQALNTFLEMVDPDYANDSDILSPVEWTVDTSSGVPRIVFDPTAEYPGPATSEPGAAEPTPDNPPN